MNVVFVKSRSVWSGLELSELSRRESTGAICGTSSSPQQAAQITNQSRRRNCEQRVRLINK